MDTFIKKCILGTASHTEIDNYIDEWHESDSKLELHEFLGMNTNEYITFVKDADSLVSIINSKREEYERVKYKNTYQIYLSLHGNKPTKEYKSELEGVITKAIKLFYSNISNVNCLLGLSDETKITFDHTISYVYKKREYTLKLTTIEKSIYDIPFDLIIGKLNRIEHYDATVTIGEHKYLFTDSKLVYFKEVSNKNVVADIDGKMYNSLFDVL